MVIKRALIFLFCLLALSQIVSAQQTAERTRNWLTVVVDSVFIRALPTQESDSVASRFEDDRLEAVGRNADGTWFQVVRPYSETVIGWIDVSLVIYDFEVTLLPITDLVTGVTGETPIVDTGISVFINQNARMRSDPGRNAPIIAILPNSITLPAVARNPAGDWVQVNYNGTLGWVAIFLVRTVNDVSALTIITPAVVGGGGNTSGVTVIPAEVQIAQIQRLRAFIMAPLEASNQLSSRIYAVTTGEIVPCTTIADVFPLYVYTAQDVRQLPELGRYGLTLNAAIEDINEAIALIGECGAYSEATLANATGLLPNRFFNGLLFTLDGLERSILNRG
jgi:hypothetical protein